MVFYIMTASVSVVVPCYQSEKTIVRAVQSVASQTLTVAELILVDDASSDRTLELLSNLKKEYQQGWIQIIHLDNNRGASFARNEGWKLAKSDYIAFLDADDSWHPHKVEFQYHWLKAHPDVDLCGHNIGYKKTGTGSALLPQLGKSIPYSKVKKWPFLLSNSLSTPTVMLKRNIKFRFDETLRYAEDYLLWLNIICDGLIVIKLDIELSYMYKMPYGESGLSQNLWEMEKGELGAYRQVLKSRSLKQYQYYFLCVFSLTKYLRRLALRGLQ